MSTEQTDKDKLEAIKCTSCGGDLAKSYRIEYEDDDEEHIPIAKCMSCSKEYDQYTQEYYALFADDLTYDKENTVFQLGDKGTIEGVEYEIIGRLRFQEEEEYEKTTWDEWLAISSEGAYHYFVEEDGKVYSYEDYVPNSIDLESSSSFIELDGRKYPKNDAYIGRVVLAEGELPYEAEIGEAVTCYDIKKDGIKYTIEQTENEVTITKGDNISYDAIIKAFGDEKEQELYAKTMAKRKEFKKKSIVYLVATLFAFFMSCHNCMYEKPVKGVMKGQKILSANKYQRDKKGYYFTSQVIYGPFNVKKAHTLYEIDVRVDESIQRLRHEWQSFRLMIIRKDRLNKLIKGVNVDQTIKNRENKKEDKKKETKKTSTRKWGSSDGSTSSSSNTGWGNGGSTGSTTYGRDEYSGGHSGYSAKGTPLKRLLDDIDSNRKVVESFTISGDFWDESGYDSDGYWHENDLKASDTFVLDKKGQYYTYIEIYSKKHRNPINVVYKMSEVRSYRYYLIVFFLLLFAFLIHRARATSYNELPFDIKD